MEIINLNNLTCNGKLFVDHGHDPHIKAYIPSTFRDNHASNLIELDNGDILCVWFAGLSEGSSDIKIAMSRLDKDNNQWSEPVMLSDDFSRSEQNPSFFQAPNGAIWLLHTAQLSRGVMTVEEWRKKVEAGEEKGHFTMQETAEVRLRTSFDRGYSWSEMTSLFTKPGAFCRHPIIILSNGDWIFPMWYSLVEEDANKPQYGRDYSVVQISSDQGQTWHEYEVPGSQRRVHMSIIETRPGHLIAFFRSRSADRIYRSSSDDFGKTWTEPLSTQLPNNNASIHAIRLHSGAIALIYNDVKGGDDPNSVLWGTPRVPLVLALTYDEGITFPYIRVIEPGDGYRGEENRNLNKAYHYPFIMQSDNGDLHISYTWHGRDCIMYHRVNEAWITGISK